MAYGRQTTYKASPKKSSPFLPILIFSKTAPVRRDDTLNGGTSGQSKGSGLSNSSTPSRRKRCLNMPNYKRIVQGVATNWIAFAVSLGVAFFLAPFIVLKLGNATYGVWTLINSM